MHSAEGEMVCRLTNPQIPYFNAGIYLQNKSKIGKVEEILGPVNRVYFTVKPDTGVNPSSFAVDDKFYIGTDKLLPLSRFLNEGKSGGGGRGGGGRGGGRGSPAGTPNYSLTNSFSYLFTFRTIGRGGRGPPGRGGFSRGGGRGSPMGRGFSRGGGRGRG